MKNRLVRGGVTVVVSLAAFIALATPAAASFESASFTGGTINIGGDSFVVGSGWNACNSHSHSMQYQTVLGTWIDPLDVVTESLVQVGASWYHVTIHDDWSLGALGGSYLSGSIVGMELGLVFTVDNAASGSTICASNGGAVLCTAATIVSLSGTYTGNLETTGDTLTLSGMDTTGGLQPWPTCNAGPFLTGEMVTASWLHAVVA